MLFEKQEVTQSQSQNNLLLFLVHGLCCLAYVICIYRETSNLLISCCCLLCLYTLLLFINNHRIVLQVLICIIVIALLYMIRSVDVKVGLNVKKTGKFSVFLLICSSIIIYCYKSLFDIKDQLSIVKLNIMWSWGMIVSSVVILVIYLNNYTDLVKIVVLYVLIWWIAYNVLPKIEITIIVLYFTNIIFAILILN